MRKLFYVLSLMIGFLVPALASAGVEAGDGPMLSDDVFLVQVTEAAKESGDVLEPDILDENLLAPLWFCCPGDPDGYEAPERDIGSDQLTPNRVPIVDVASMFNLEDGMIPVINTSGYFWANNGPEDPDG